MTRKLSVSLFAFFVRRYRLSAILGFAGAFEDTGVRAYKGKP
jgi:hypothetical protein